MCVELVNNLWFLGLAGIGKVLEIVALESIQPLTASSRWRHDQLALPILKCAGCFDIMLLRSVLVRWLPHALRIAHEADTSI